MILIMKQLYSKNILLLWLACLTFIGNGIAKKEFVKTYEETYTLAKGGKVDLENRYGQIDIRTWSKNEVNIKVSIKVNTTSDSKAESTFERIKIAFGNSGGVVSAKTVIDSQKSFWNFLQRWWGDADLSINYEVNMPASAPLEVENKYGDLKAPCIEGNVVLNVKYGNFTLDHAANDLIVDLGYGNGVVAKTNQANINLAYGKIRVNDANEVVIDSKFSKVTIESANKITSESGYDGYDLGDIGTFINEGKYDNIKIQKVEEISIETKYTKVDVNELTISAFARHSYGGLTIDNVAATVTEIDAKGKYTGFEIDLGGLPNFQFEADTKYTKLHLPDGINFTKVIKENNEHYVEGYRGNNSTNVQVKLSAHYGGLRLR